MQPSRAHVLARKGRTELLALLLDLAPEWGPIQREAACNHWSKERIIDQVITLEQEDPSDEAACSAARSEHAR